MNVLDKVLAGYGRLDAGDADAFRAIVCDLFADDGELVTPAGTVVGGPAAADMWKGFMDAFDLHHTFGLIAEHEDALVVEVVSEMRHSRTLVLPDGTEVPATDRSATSPACNIIRSRDGKITSWHQYWDQLNTYTQLGLIPEPATT
jgi:ketosteroid isomerase-like protein